MQLHDSEITCEPCIFCAYSLNSPPREGHTQVELYLALYDKISHGIPAGHGSISIELR